MFEEFNRLRWNVWYCVVSATIHDHMVFVFSSEVFVAVCWKREKTFDQTHFAVSPRRLSLQRAGRQCCVEFNRRKDRHRYRGKHLKPPIISSAVVQLYTHLIYHFISSSMISLIIIDDDGKQSKITYLAFQHQHNNNNNWEFRRHIQPAPAH